VPDDVVMRVLGLEVSAPASRARAAALLVFLLILVTAVISACGSQKYSCVAQHCYAMVTWTGNPTGFSMEETPVPLTSGDGHVSDEGWLLQCQPGPIQNCTWVETGEVNDKNSGTNYFWANNVPPYGFMAYPLGPVAQSDEQGTYIAFQVRQDPQTPTQWDITISRPASGTVLYSVQAAGIPMTPSAVEEGLEIEGSQGAQAPLAFFAKSEVFQGSAEHLRTSNGVVTSDDPPNGGWLGSDTPANQNSPDSQNHPYRGGVFVTDCC
jgi:hypothetical protein